MTMTAKQLARPDYDLCRSISMSVIRQATVTCCGKPELGPKYVTHTDRITNDLTSLLLRVHKEELHA